MSDPLVLVHGFMGGSAQWQSQQDELGNRFDMVAVDLPGFGENRQAEAPDTIAAYAGYVLGYLNERGIERFNLLGHSMGGMIVQEMLAQQPQLVKRLILYGTSAASVVEGRFESYEESKRRARADGAQATARRIASTWFKDFEKAANYEACARIAEKASLTAILAGIDAFGNWSREDNLTNIDCPVLIVWGEHDRSYAWQQIEQLWRTIPNTSLAVVPGCSHAVHMEKPRLFNAIIEDFLQSEPSLSASHV